MSDDPMLTAVLGDEIEPLFWGSIRCGVPSAWYGHVPFAHWLVTLHRPRIVVELGTHYGVSHFAFCHAMILGGGFGQCFAVDTWQGDEHAGFYGEEVFQDVAAFSSERCTGCSVLLRTTFDAALADFADNTVDLLHIDGLHTYDAVRHDFEAWLPKLSPRAIVLLHDIDVRERGFGVWRFWEELVDCHPSFSFAHASGLGMVTVGSEVSAAAAALCALRGTPSELRLRQRFYLMGDLVQRRAQP